MAGVGFDRTKSLQDLEQHNWGDPAPTDTPLIAKCILLRRKPLADFTAEDFRIMIGQQIGLSFLIPLALEVLATNPLEEGDFYPGDLLCAVLRLDEEFWIDHPDSIERMQHVTQKAQMLLATSQEGIGNDIRQEIEGAPRMLRTATSLPEEELCRALRSILQALPDDADIPQSPAFIDALQRVEWYLPGVVREIHPEFDYCFDGIEPRLARKLGENTMEVRGLVWLLDDSCSLIPLHVRLQVATDEDVICWLECRLGKRSQAGSTGSVRKRLDTLDPCAEAIDWAYEVGFGQRK